MAIRALEALERMCSDNGFEYSKDDFANDYKEVETTLEALEIIKEKLVDAYSLKLIHDVDEYNAYTIHWESQELTPQEYELLKEVLG